MRAVGINALAYSFYLLLQGNEMHQSTTDTNQTGSAPDPFNPSGRFAKVPSEVLYEAASGDHAMSHAEFRVFVALCRYRGKAGRVNPTRETLSRLCAISPQNISRATKRLEALGWLRIDHAGEGKHRRIENYHLQLPRKQ